jgi:hypothetical protein
MQADAEHQQDDADLGQLIGEILVADEARCERAGGDTGEEIADERRNPQSVGDGPEDESKA